MKRKGVYFLPLLILEIIAGPGIIGAIGMISAQADIQVQSGINSLRTAPMAKSTATYLRQHYLNDSANYSAYQASYELGSEGGELDWSESAGLPPGAETAQGQWEQRVAQILNDDYFEGEFPAERTRCRIDFPETGVAVEEPFTAVATGGERTVHGTTYRLDGDAVAVTCATTPASTAIGIDVSQLRLSQGNGYFLMYRLMADEVPVVNSDIDELSGETYSGSGSSCDSASDALREAKSDARSDARGAIENKFDPFTGDLPDGVDVKTTAVDPTADVVSTDTGTIDDGCSETNCPDDSGSGDGSSSDSGDCTTTYWDKDTASATAEPSGGSMTLGLVATNRSVPTADGYQQIEFLVEDASFSVD